MPYKNPKKDRNYKKEYADYHGTEKQKENRATRNAARAKLAKKGVVKKGDGKDVDHKKPLSKGGTNAAGNLRAKPKSKNRSFKRKSDHSMK